VISTKKCLPLIVLLCPKLLQNSYVPLAQRLAIDHKTASLFKIFNLTCLSTFSFSFSVSLIIRSFSGLFSFSHAFLDNPPSSQTENSPPRKLFLATRKKNRLVGTPSLIQEKGPKIFRRKSHFSSVFSHSLFS
jgi:hypothetical protein